MCMRDFIVCHEVPVTFRLGRHYQALGVYTGYPTLRDWLPISGLPSIDCGSPPTVQRVCDAPYVSSTTPQC